MSMLGYTRLWKISTMISAEQFVSLKPQSPLSDGTRINGSKIQRILSLVSSWKRRGWLHTPAIPSTKLTYHTPGQAHRCPVV
jgi:hypothetical protein